MTSGRPRPSESPSGPVSAEGHGDQEQAGGRIPACRARPLGGAREALRRQRGPEGVAREGPGWRPRRVAPAFPTGRQGSWGGPGPAPSQSPTARPAGAEGPLLQRRPAEGRFPPPGTRAPMCLPRTGFQHRRALARTSTAGGAPRRRPGSVRSPSRRASALCTSTRSTAQAGALPGAGLADGRRPHGSGPGLAGCAPAGRFLLAPVPGRPGEAGHGLAPPASEGTAVRAGVHAPRAEAFGTRHGVGRASGLDCVPPAGAAPPPGACFAVRAAARLRGASRCWWRGRALTVS